MKLEINNKFAISSLLLSSIEVINIAFADLSTRSFEIEYSGTTTNKSRWHRPQLNYIDCYKTLDRQATNVPYSVRGFTVDDSGIYDFVSTNRSTGWQMSGFLYRDKFDPDRPLNNLMYGIIGRTPLFAPPSLDRFEFQTKLMAGCQYFLVISGRSNRDAGGFATSISGVGNILFTAARVQHPFLTFLGDAIGKRLLPIS